MFWIVAIICFTIGVYFIPKLIQSFKIKGIYKLVLDLLLVIITIWLVCVSIPFIYATLLGIMVRLLGVFFGFSITVWFCILPFLSTFWVIVRQNWAETPAK